ncbi:MAG: MarR family winged helix-turn-helix transcriptional regulator [Steroidobacteraceae bacterium]
MARAVVKGAISPGRGERRARTAGDRWLDGFIPYRLYRATRKLGARLHTRLRALRISPSQWRVLSVLKAFGDLSIGEIVEATLMEQPTISRVVARLERDGRVKRRLSSRDSRMALISLTASGVEAFKQIIPAALRHQDEALQGVGRKEIARLVATLEKIERNIESHD